MAGLWRWVGQCRGVVVVLQVGAGLPFPVLPEVFFPAGDAEQFDEQTRVPEITDLGLLVYGVRPCVAPDLAGLPVMAWGSVAKGE